MCHTTPSLCAKSTVFWTMNRKRDSLTLVTQLCVRSKFYSLLTGVDSTIKSKQFAIKIHLSSFIISALLSFLTILIFCHSLGFLVCDTFFDCCDNQEICGVFLLAALLFGQTKGSEVSWKLVMQNAEVRRRGSGHKHDAVSDVDFCIMAKTDNWGQSLITNQHTVQFHDEDDVGYAWYIIDVNYCLGVIPYQI